MPFAIITHEAAAATDGGALGAALNTWYIRKITGVPINEQTIVSSSDTSAGVYSFTLEDGTYRIEAEMSFYVFYTYSATGDNATAVAVLYNNTTAAVAAYFSPAYQSNSASSLASTGTSGATIPYGRMVTLRCNGVFAVSSGPNVFTFRAAGNSSAEVWVANTNACGIAHGSTGVVGGAIPVNIYLMAKITQKQT